MTVFEYLSVALSFVLGLGVTHLLVSAARLFKRRDEVSWDWVTLVWAATVFVHQIHFWWAVFGLNDLPSWSLAGFLILLTMGLLLFIAGALVLPDVDGDGPIDIASYFERTGRWALAAILSYDLFGIAFDYVLFDVPVLSQMNLIRMAYVPVLVLGAVTASRTTRGAVSVVYLAALLVWIGFAAPMSY